MASKVSGVTTSEIRGFGGQVDTFGNRIGPEPILPPGARVSVDPADPQAMELIDCGAILLDK